MWKTPTAAIPWNLQSVATKNLTWTYLNFIWNCQPLTRENLGTLLVEFHVGPSTSSWNPTAGTCVELLMEPWTFCSNRQPFTGSFIWNLELSPQKPLNWTFNLCWKPSIYWILTFNETFYWNPFTGTWILLVYMLELSTFIGTLFAGTFRLNLRPLLEPFTRTENLQPLICRDPKVSAFGENKLCGNP